jgi:hypothetical protein
MVSGRDWRRITRQLTAAAVFIVGGVAASTPALAQSASAPCIAMMMPEVKGMSGQADELGNAVRELFASYLTAPTFKTISLEAKLPMVALNEAKEKECPNVLVVTLTGKQSSNKLGKLVGSAAGSAAVYVPGSSSTGANVVRGAVHGTGYAISSLASSTKAKDEVKLEFRIQTPEKATKIGPASEQAKAEVNGEDILTPVVQRAATQIATALMKR